MRALTVIHWKEDRLQGAKVVQEVGDHIAYRPVVLPYHIGERDTIHATQGVIAGEDTPPRLRESLGMHPLDGHSKFAHQRLEEVQPIEVPIAVKDVVNLALVNQSLQRTKDKGREVLAHLFLQDLPYMNS